MITISREASELGLRPGHWPATITLDEGVFQRGGQRDCNGEVVSVDYYCQRSTSGEAIGEAIKLVVWND